MLTVRVTNELLDLMDEWRAVQRPIPTRAEVIRTALRKLLEKDESNQ